MYVIMQIASYIYKNIFSFYLYRIHYKNILRAFACAIHPKRTNIKKYHFKYHLHLIVNRIDRVYWVLPPVFAFAFSAANLMDSVQCGSIVSVARRQDDTMDTLPNQFQIRPLSRTVSDTIRSKFHDRRLGTNGAKHGVRNESMRANDACVNPYYP